ncbi:MAG: hypothetical protein H6742_17700 [Alphaproteobacteria bacterium]|nr:hypothetical protein [Alphaproteobacteria bacterium]
MRPASLLLSAVLLLGLSSPALAKGGKGGGGGGRKVAVLLAPAQLTVPQAELTVDIKVAPRTSVAPVIALDLSGPIRLGHFGGQLRHSFAGTWERGAFLAAEVVTGDGSWKHEDSTGVAFGGMAGGRYTFTPALTLEGGIGGRVHWDGSKAWPGALVHLGIGWSF